MNRENRADGHALVAGNFLLVCLLLGGCFEVHENVDPIHMPEEKEEEESARKSENLQEIQPVHEIDVNREEELEVQGKRLIEKFLAHLEEEQWQMVTLQIEDPAEIKVPSDDFNEPQIAHAVLGKQDHSMNYAWLEINGINSRFNEVWKKHWAMPLADSGRLNRELLTFHLENIQQKYELLLDQVKEMEFKNATEYAQHLHDYKLYLEGAVLYRIEAASALLEALETGERLDVLVAEAVEAAIESDAYVRMCDAELLNYQQSFQADLKWNHQ